MMTTNANAPVETRHKETAAKLWSYVPGSDNRLVLAQSLANLEAANNRLAEIETIADVPVFTPLLPAIKAIKALASGHTPSPCPGCAAKDEAMEAFKADVSEVVTELLSWPSHDTPFLRSRLERFIIPPADPLAEALKAAVQDAWDGPCSTEESTVAAVTRNLMANLAKHGLELSRLGGAK